MAPLNIRCEARLNIVSAFEQIGLELFAEPGDGIFVWARSPHIEDSLDLAEASQRDGIMLAPGTVFNRIINVRYRFDFT
jgi:aspartate/methionine/tyrosine aminotransferase